jgi:hypothetical protein
VPLDEKPSGVRQAGNAIQSLEGVGVFDCGDVQRLPGWLQRVDGLGIARSVIISQEKNLAVASPQFHTTLEAAKTAWTIVKQRTRIPSTQTAAQ